MGSLAPLLARHAPLATLASSPQEVSFPSCLPTAPPPGGLSHSTPVPLLLQRQASWLPTPAHAAENTLKSPSVSGFSVPSRIFPGTPPSIPFPPSLPFPSPSPLSSPPFRSYLPLSPIPL